jgi:hypothetical protein
MLYSAHFLPLSDAGDIFSIEKHLHVGFVPYLAGLVSRHSYDCEFEVSRKK